MKSKHPLPWLFILISTCWLLSNSQLAQAAEGLTIGNYQLVSSKRITRTVFEYTYKASITNTGNDAVGVSATLNTNSPGVTVLDNQLDFGDVPNGKTIASTDTFVIQQDRQHSFKVDALQWLIDSSPANGSLDNLGISLEFPPEWHAEKYANTITFESLNDSNQRHVTRDDTFVFFKVSRLVNANLPELPIEEWFDAYFSLGFSSVVSVKEFLTVAGRDAVRIESKGVGTHINIYITDKSDVVEVSYETDNPHNITDYEAMLQSLTFTE